jgi:hypothetical protein
VGRDTGGRGCGALSGDFERGKQLKQLAPFTDWWFRWYLQLKACVCPPLGVFSGGGGSSPCLLIANVCNAAHHHSSREVVGLLREVPPCVTPTHTSQVRRLQVCCVLQPHLPGVPQPGVPAARGGGGSSQGSSVRDADTNGRQRLLKHKE